MGCLLFFDSCAVEEGPCRSYIPGNLIGLSRVFVLQFHPHVVFENNYGLEMIRE
jgi:hypothetical protein